MDNKIKLKVKIIFYFKLQFASTDLYLKQLVFFYM